MKNLFPVIVMLLTLSQELLAGPSRYYIGSDAGRHEPTTVISVRAQNMKTGIERNETATSSSFNSLDKNYEVDINSFSLDLQQELFNEKKVSLQLGLRYGKGQGEFEGKNSSEEIYKDEIENEFYSTGAGINVNTVGYGLKIQPFYFMQYIQSHSNSELVYTGATGSNIELQSKIDETIMQHSVGVRFINSPKGLLSYFSLDYSQQVDSGIKTQTKVDDESVKLKSGADLQEESIGVSIGIGLMI